ncbi:hypothetical protein ACFP81_01680 [Deinococcus lacus]|uniref:Uncharacterized protein n=1 Tax=Deinococcus lacus TaxID=392561 RepID=A0ABW1Y9K2_9DEIO
MGRRERFSQYQWAAWPDEGLLAAAQHLYMPYVARVEQNLSGRPDLVVEVGGEYFEDLAELTAKYAANGQGAPGPTRMLRLSWDTGLMERVYAVETTEEFYAGFLFGTHQSAAAVGSMFAEIVSDPDPWLMQLLRDSPDTGVFPPYGSQGELRVLEYHPESGAFSGAGRGSPPRYRHLFINSNSVMVEILCEGLPRWEWG